MKPASLKTAIQDVAKAMPVIERDLNAADAKLGDGDTGGMLARVVLGLQAAELDEADLGASLIALSRAANEATGSSLGNLMATALGAIGRKVRGQAELRPDQLSEVLGIARDAMLERGGADLGDKTVIDSIDAIARAVSDGNVWAAIRSAAHNAAADTLMAFRGKPIRTGRARMFGDATRDLDDPGMLAVSMLLDAIIHEESKV
jgi:hypothetical protein